MLVNIEAERARRRMSKKELAENLGVSLRTYYNWISRKTDIPSTALKKMSEMFGVKMEYLIDDLEEKDAE